jgi:hypothetical protein
MNDDTKLMITKKNNEASIIMFPDELWWPV